MCHKNLMPRGFKKSCLKNYASCDLDKDSSSKKLKKLKVIKKVCSGPYIGKEYIWYTIIISLLTF